VFMLHAESKSRPVRSQRVHTSEEAPVMGVEQRGPRKVEGGRIMNSEEPPAQVPLATQAGDVRRRGAWTEPSVWTDRMLTALEQGVKGGVWLSVLAERVLCGARAV
jgi:hypothetical protein